MRLLNRYEYGVKQDRKNFLFGRVWNKTPQLSKQYNQSKRKEYELGSLEDVIDWLNELITF